MNRVEVALSHLPSSSSTRPKDVMNYRDLLTVDFGKKHPMVNLDMSEKVDGTQLAQDIAHVTEHGYVILNGLVDEVERLLSTALRDIEPLLTRNGRNNFEGVRTRRVYTVAGKTLLFDPLIEHPRILGLLNHFLMPNYLLQMSQVIRIFPGEKEQMPHLDDGYVPWPRPRPPQGCSTIWALDDDFTETNGATYVYPKSHLWPEGRGPNDATDEKVTVVMPRGSCVFFLGSLWHGGGQNVSSRHRTAFTAQYCQPYLRTQENMFLGISKEMVKPRSAIMKSMMGYSVHPPFVGQLDGMSPLRALE